MSPLILNPESNKSKLHIERALDSRWLTAIETRCSAAQAFLAGEQREARCLDEEVWTLIYEDIPTLVRKLNTSA